MQIPMLGLFTFSICINMMLIVGVILMLSLGCLSSNFPFLLITLPMIEIYKFTVTSQHISPVMLSGFGCLRLSCHVML